MQHHEEIVKYFKSRGVAAIFLFRRNLLRRMISVLANSYDREVKLLNGTHKSHVHSPIEVSFFSISLSYAETLVGGFYYQENVEIPMFSHFSTFLTSPMKWFPGRNTSKIQAYDQCNIADSQPATSRGDNNQSFGVLQQHSAYCPLLRGCGEKPHCKQSLQLNYFSAQEYISPLVFNQSHIHMSTLDLTEYKTGA